MLYWTTARFWIRKRPAPAVSIKIKNTHTRFLRTFDCSRFFRRSLTFATFREFGSPTTAASLLQTDSLAQCYTTLLGLGVYGFAQYQHDHGVLSARIYEWNHMVLVVHRVHGRFWSIRTLACYLTACWTTDHSIDLDFERLSQWLSSTISSLMCSKVPISNTVDLLIRSCL
jgi:hypothetical protein